MAGLITVDGQQYGTGLIRRNFETHPPGCMAYAPEFPESELILPSEQKDYFAVRKAAKSRLLDLREENYETLQSLNQKNFGLCWAFSTTKVMMYLRAIMNQPALILSAWYVAGMIKGWRDQGGWGAESLEFVRNNGVPTMAKCPSYSSKYATADVAAEAATNKATEWWDGSDSRAKNKQIAISMLLKGVPCVADLNNMSHSMALVDYDPNTDTWTFDNSWGPDYAQKGLHVIQGDNGIPDALVVPRVATASPL